MLSGLSRLQEFVVAAGTAGKIALHAAFETKKHCQWHSFLLT